MIKTASISLKFIFQLLRLSLLPSPISTTNRSSPAVIKIHVSALPGLGNGDLEPQTAALKASSLGKLFDAEPRAVNATTINLSCTEGNWIITQEVIPRINEAIITLINNFISTSLKLP